MSPPSNRPKTKGTPRRAGGSPAKKRPKKKKSPAKGAGNESLENAELAVHVEDEEMEMEDEMEADDALDEQAIYAAWMQGADDVTSADHAARAALALANALSSAVGSVVGIVGSTAAALRCSELMATQGATIVTDDGSGTLYAQADVVVVLECLSSTTALMINEGILDQMKAGATLIAPSPLCNAVALNAALQSKKLGGFGCLGRISATLEAQVIYSSLTTESPEALGTRVVALSAILQPVQPAVDIS